MGRLWLAKLGAAGQVPGTVAIGSSITSTSHIFLSSAPLQDQQEEKSPEEMVEAPAGNNKRRIHLFGVDVVED
jgi:hypothetical protein